MGNTESVSNTNSNTIGDIKSKDKTNIKSIMKKPVQKVTKQKIYNSFKFIEPVYKKFTGDLNKMSLIKMSNLNVNQLENVKLPSKYISLHLRGGDFRPPKSLNGLIPEIDIIVSELLKNCNKYQIKDVFIADNDKILFTEVLNKLLGHELNIYYIEREKILLMILREFITSQLLTILHFTAEY